MPLDKNPTLQPIGVGAAHHRIARKVIMSIVNNNVTKAVENLELCGGHYAGCEAAVHFMHGIFSTNETEAVLLIDTEHAFNSINRQVFLHNNKHIYPPVARLFVFVNKELLSHEGTTQGN